ncbi:MAG: hypothetical protein HC769_10945 [Cyanobacteria bacterium CRU_2_1]|nr:hypothetical protein [Hydrococcus sp. RU_2_2]NJR59313.1 hypothetical protein [Cyanobacteria bacterium CRU_2_1]
MSFLMQVADGASNFPVAFTLVYVVGFIAAVAIGSIAWYNSKRPPGWEDKPRPDVVPKVDADNPKV